MLKLADQRMRLCLLFEDKSGLVLQVLLFFAIANIDVHVFDVAGEDLSIASWGRFLLSSSTQAKTVSGRIEDRVIMIASE